jgi:hypothetical protein
MSLKSYRLYGDEMEVLGRRLDSARKSLAGAKSDWARNYWRQNVERLLFQWRQLPILHDGDAQVTIVPRWNTDYNYYELGGDFGGYDYLDKFIDTVFNKEVDLTPSWEAHRAQRLAKAQ